jgi:hypothetical protein
MGLTLLQLDVASASNPAATESVEFLTGAERTHNAYYRNRRYFTLFIHKGKDVL